MTWIKTIGYDEADRQLRSLYDRIKSASGHVDNIMVAHSLRPHTMTGHMTLYKYVLHHPANVTPKWFLECLGVYASMLNRCTYCVEHHAAGMTRLLNDSRRAKAILAAVAALTVRALEGNDEVEDGDANRASPGAMAELDERELLALDYGRQLIQAPWRISAAHLTRLRQVGWSDGEILEINQVVSYFAYANRMVLGLGVTIDDEELGTSPGDPDDPENWAHR